METMVLCSTARGISSPIFIQQKNLSTDLHIHSCKINHSPFCLKQKKGFSSSGLKYRGNLRLRSATSEETSTETTQTTTSYVIDEPETTSKTTSFFNDEPTPVTEPEATSETTPSEKDESETKPEPEPTSETTSYLTDEPESKPETAVVVEDSCVDEKKSDDETPIIAEVLQESSTEVDYSQQLYKILESVGIKLDSEDKTPLYVLGAGTVTALWLTSTILGAVDKIPVLPKVLELVGIGYTVWFSYNNLIFKEKREEIFAKIEQIKEEVLGSEED